eukprot:3796238-Rhodomonas_salina.1
MQLEGRYLEVDSGTVCHGSVEMLQHDRLQSRIDSHGSQPMPVFCRLPRRAGQGQCQGVPATGWGVELLGWMDQGRPGVSRILSYAIRTSVRA